MVLSKASTPAANGTCACCVVGPGVSKSPKRSTWPGNARNAVYGGLMEAWYACHAAGTKGNERRVSTQGDHEERLPLQGTARHWKALEGTGGHWKALQGGKSKTRRKMLRQMLQQVESLQAHPLTSMQGSVCQLRYRIRGLCFWHNLLLKTCARAEMASVYATIVRSSVGYITFWTH